MKAYRTRIVPVDIPGLGLPTDPRAKGRTLLTILFLFTFIQLGAQSKSELKNKTERLKKRIEYNEKLVEKNKREAQLTQTELVLLNKKIAYREELIATIDRQIRNLEGRIQEKQALIRSLKKDLETLKEEYAKMIREAFTNRNSYDRLMFIFGSDGLYQAWKRVKYLQQYARYRQRQARSIEKTRKMLQDKLSTLKEKKAEKKALLEEKRKEKKKMARDKGQQQQNLTRLRQKEQSLKEKLKAQKRRRERLEEALNEILAKEKRAIRSKNKGGFSLTPEAKALSTNFEKNRGKLPWPVQRGEITSTFGEHAHPTLRGIKVKNNGVDIATTKGSPVRAVFKGTVSSVLVIPGSGKAVVLKHGGYRTVYSNLRESFVEKGDQVSVKEELGQLITREDENKSELHFEIREISSKGIQKKDPTAWIVKR